MEKNVAGQIWIVFAFNKKTNDPLSGDANNITANLRIDGGSANPVDDLHPTESEDGFYFFSLSQSETNGNNIFISPESSTVDIQVIGCPAAIYTTPPNFNSSNVVLATIAGDVVNLDGDAMRGTNNANIVVPDVAGTAPTAVENRQEMDSNSSKLQAIEGDTDTTIPDLITGLQDLSIADVQTALSNQGYTIVRSDLLDNLDATISSVMIALGSVQDDLNNPNQYKADISLLSLEGSLQAVKTKTDLLKDSWNDPTASVIADAVLDSVSS